MILGFFILTACGIARYSVPPSSSPAALTLGNRSASIGLIEQA